MKPGTSIGRFTIERPLAAGGMGAVCLARDEDGTRVAIKTVTSDARGQAMSLRREIRALLQIEHPSIVGVVDHGLYDAVPWIAMEHVDGWSFRRRFEASIPTSIVMTTPVERAETRRSEEVSKRYVAPPIPEGHAAPTPEEQRELLGYMTRVLRGLGFVHAEGLVHRDLKPENIVVRESDGEPILIDFGIATFAGGDQERLAHVADSAGTPSYMAPEQIRGSWTDARADLYSVGCMMFEIVTGRAPYDGESSLEVMSGHLYGELPELPADTDDELRALITELLSKEPSDRPGYAHDVARRLEEILGLESPAEPLPRGYLYRADLEGRDELLGQCMEVVEALDTSRGEAYLVAGPPGSGKTRFAVELATRVRSSKKAECLLVEMSAEATERSPFEAMLADLCDRCRDRGVEFTRVVFGPDAAVLAKEYPGISDLPGLEDIETVPNLPRKLEILRRTKAWIDVTMRLFGGRPVVVVVDEFAARYIDFVDAFRSVQMSRAAPMSIFLTIDQERSAVVRDFPGDRLFQLRPLEVDESVRQVKTMLALDDIPDFIREFVEHRGRGNPARLADYLHMAMSRGLLWRDAGKWVVDPDPESWGALPSIDDHDAVAAARLAALPAGSRELLEAIHVHGAPIPLLAVSQLLGGRSRLGDLDPLLSQGYLVARSGSLAIADGRFRGAISAELSNARIKEIHGRLADAMDADGLRDSERRGRHLFAAGRLEEARPILRARGDEYEDTDTRRSLELYRMFLDTDPPADLRTAQTYVSTTQLLQRMGHFEESAHLCLAGEEVAREAGEPSLETRLAIERAHCSFSNNRDEALELLERSLERAREIGEPFEICLGLQYRGAIHATSSELVEAEECYREAFELGKLIEGKPHVASGVNLGAMLVRLGKMDEARAVFEALVPICHTGGFLFYEAYALGNLGIIAREHLNDHDEALDLLRRAERAHLDYFDQIGACSALCEQLHTLVRMRRFREIFAEAERLDIRTMVTSLGPTMQLRAKTALFDAFVGRGRYAQARESVGDWLTDAERPWVRKRAVLLLAGLSRRRGDYDEARRQLDIASEIPDTRVDNIFAEKIEKMLLDLATGGGPETVPDAPDGATVAYPRVQRDRLSDALDAREAGETLIHGESPARLAMEMPVREKN